MMLKMDQEAYYNILDEFIGIADRRGVFRGKNLGSRVTAEQYNSIDSGHFKGFFIGDYWEINGITWRIADMDYWIVGYNDLTQSYPPHHLVIVPDQVIGNTKMYDTIPFTGGFMSSNIGLNLGQGVADETTAIRNAFEQSHILLRREHALTANNDTSPIGWGWVDNYGPSPMNAMMVFGDFDMAIDAMSRSFAQLAMFSIYPYMIRSRMDGLVHSPAYWLSDVANGKQFLCVTGSGMKQRQEANTLLGIRPAFGLVKQNPPIVSS